MGNVSVDKMVKPLGLDPRDSAGSIPARDTNKISVKSSQNTEGIVGFRIITNCCDRTILTTQASKALQAMYLFRTQGSGVRILIEAQNK
jgi:hypothetical protein